MPPENAALPLGPAQLIRFDTTALASPTQPKGIPPSVQENGNGLAATLGYLALNQPEQFQAIVSEYKKVIRNVSRIRFNEQQQGNGTTKSLLFDFLGAPGVRASLVSSGTLYTLGLLTVILGPNQPRVILFDDLDHGLHPKAQMELIEVLRKLLDQYPDLQIIATSHSPYILDKLQPNEVRVMALNDDGSAACARLEDHPKYPMWKDSMSPGEFWSHAGEDWVKKLHLEPVAQ